MMDTGDVYKGEIRDQQMVPTPFLQLARAQRMERRRTMDEQGKLTDKSVRLHPDGRVDGKMIDPVRMSLEDHENRFTPQHL